jgi:uncharacterized protein (DUF2236 family)
MRTDHGYFGPDSVMWKVNRETTVLFGGARALLMHSAHPLVAAGARQTGGYRRDPWFRLIRTVQLQNLVTFGSVAEADEAADRINKLHKTIKGDDPVTGGFYDSLAHDLLLWVHAALEVSTVLFYELTVGPLSRADKDQYHEENKLAAELLWLPRAAVPGSYADMEEYVDGVIGGDELAATDVSAEVAELIRTGRSVPTHIQPVWKLIAFAATGTLDPRLRELHGLRWSPGRQRVLDANLAVIRATRPFLPYRFRVILPARWAELRQRDLESI